MPTRVSRTILVVLLCIATPGTARAGTPALHSPRHYVSLLGGYARHLSEVRSIYYTIDAAAGAPGYAAPLAHALDLGIRYRFALEPGKEIVAEGHRVQAWGTERGSTIYGPYEFAVEHRTDWVGLGFRTSDVDGRVRPFFGMTLVHAREYDGGESGDLVGTNLGWAAATGVDIEIGSALSLPVELAFMFAQPYHDVSTLGLRTGLTWHP